MENKRLTFAFCSPFFYCVIWQETAGTIPLCTMDPAGEHSVLSRNTKERNAPFNFQFSSSL